MGYDDANWALLLQGGGLAHREKVVLLAIALRTLDTTHETFVGQQAIAASLACSVEHVTRGLKTLESLGVITRTRRNGPGGYRTSDLITLNRAYTADSQQGQEPSRPTANKADSRNLPGSQSSPTRPTAGAEEKNQENNQKNNQRVERTRATRIPDPFNVSQTMREWAAAEVPGVDVDRSTRTFVDYWRAESGAKATKRDWIATWRNWLRRDAERTGGGRQSTSVRAHQTLAAGRRLTRTEENLAVVAEIAAREGNAERSIFDEMLDRKPQEDLDALTIAENDATRPHQTGGRAW